MNITGAMAHFPDPAPLFHEDGDMVDIFLDEPPNGLGKFRVSDHGMTVMRLSYSYDLDTENKQRIFNRILAENRIQQSDGRLYIETEAEGLYPAILQLAQTVAKVSSMQYFKREVIQSLFYEQLAEFIEERLAEYNPRPRVLPIPGHDEYEADYQFDAGPRPLYLFGVKDSDKARLVTISCLEFQRRRLPFKSVMVHQDFESGISKLKLLHRIHVRLAIMIESLAVLCFGRSGITLRKFAVSLQNGQAGRLALGNCRFYDLPHQVEAHAVDTSRRRAFGGKFKNGHHIIAVVE